MPPEGTIIIRVLVGTVIGFVLGFERGLRGSPTGDRTFSLIGAASTAVTAIAFDHSPQTVAGVVTGIGFIGGGVVFHGQGSLVRGITTAATVFLTAAVGVVVGSGELLAGVVLGLLALVVLEIRYLPFLRMLDADSYRHHFRQDADFQDSAFRQDPEAPK